MDKRPPKCKGGAEKVFSTSALPVEEGGEVAGSEKQKQHTDRDHRAMGASEENI